MSVQVSPRTFVPDVVVLGGGLSGCLVAQNLRARGRKVVIVEQNDSLGGLLRPVKILGFDCDQGPHFFFHDWERSAIRDRVESIVEIRDCEPYAWTFPTGCLGEPHSYPVSAEAAGEQVVSVPLARRAPNREPGFLRPAKKAFSEQTKSIVGEELYARYFEGFTRKFWGVSPERLSGDWISKKIRVENGHAPFFGGKAVYRPRGGFGRLLRNLTAGLKVIRDRVVGLAIGGSVVSAVVCREAGQLTARAFVSTLRPDVLLGEASLRIRGLVLVYVAVRSATSPFSSARVHWGYFPNHYAFTRLTDMNKSCQLSSAIPRILCFEFPVWSDGAATTESCEKEAAEFLRNYYVGSDIVVMSSERVPEAYPVLSMDDEAKLRDIEIYLDSFQNLFRVGRFGEFRLAWMADAVERAAAVGEEVDVLLSSLPRTVSSSAEHVLGSISRQRVSEDLR